MNTSMVGTVLHEALIVAVKLAGPALISCMLIGILVAIFQAVTSIHEQSLGFILKLIAVMLFLLIGGIVVLLGGIALLVYYLSFGIFYDDESILVSAFLKKSRTYVYSDIVHQTVLIAGGTLLAEVYFADGSAITVASNMDGAVPFLDHAFARWCEAKGLEPRDCDFHDPSKFRWFPAEEEPREEER